MSDFFANLGSGFRFPNTQMNSGPLPSVGAGAPEGAGGDPDVGRCDRKLVYVWIYVCMHVCMYVWYVYMYGHMYVCMYVCMYGMYI